MNARQALFDSLAAPLIEQVEALGGAIASYGKLSGGLEVDIDSNQIIELATRTDLYHLSLAASYGHFAWFMGDGRADSRVGADRFINQGFTGARPNSARHNYGDITIAVTDSMLEDEACFLYSTPNCTGTSRLRQRFECADADLDGDICETVANFNDLDTNFEHGTGVASIAMADYTNNQGDGYSLGDMTTNHSATCEQRATGMAPDASLLHFAVSDTPGPEMVTDALSDSLYYNPDVHNINNCLRDPCFSLLGGADVQVSGTNYPGALSTIAMVAPTRVTGHTSQVDDYGTVPAWSFGGTSGAAPAVAGAAALVKDLFLGLGKAWVNDPGWLYTIMLGMTDRAREQSPGVIVQTTAGSDDVYGFGRIRLRSFNTGGGLGLVGTTGISTFSTIAFSTSAFNLWPSPLPAGTNLVKCVSYNAEDMTPPKVSISEVELRMRTFVPDGAGTCNTYSAGQLVNSAIDTSLDVKHQAVFTTPSVTLANRCVRAELWRSRVHAQGVTTYLFCYYSGKRDNEAPI